MSDPIWITEQDVVELMNLGDAIDALEQGLREEARGQARNMDKTQLAWGHSNLHALGALFAEQTLAATKTWMHSEGGATPLLVLIGAENGSIKAIIEAFALGQMRTGGIAGVATRWLASAQADDLALIGTGKQALLQVASVHAVRPLKRLRVFSPNPNNRNQFIERVKAEFDFEVHNASSVAEATRGASIITLVTRATSPFLEASMIEPGAHLNAVGAIGPDREEFAQDVFARATRIAVDSLPAVQQLSKEFRTRFGPDGAQWETVAPLSRVVNDEIMRETADDITLFKAMGMGISDLSLAVEIYARAQSAGKGRPFPHPQRAHPNMHAFARPRPT